MNTLFVMLTKAVSIFARLSSKSSAAFLHSLMSTFRFSKRWEFPKANDMMMQAVLQNQCGCRQMQN